MAEPLLEARNITLTVPIFRPSDRKLMANPSRFIADLYLSRTRRGFATILERVSFRLEPGDRLGIIGFNGAGKSSLLRVLAGIYQPTSGKLIRNGKAKGMFDIAIGMLPDATGLENIYLRGLQMGLSIREIRALIPTVVSFAELEEDIEKPIHTYSSGMSMRLAFSISTMIEPDILLLDEWIGAGDASFAEKVKQRMHGLVDRSRGLVLATHNMALMRQLCTKGLVLTKGRVSFFGDLTHALDIYSEDVAQRRLAAQGAVA
jgi:ABC-type polysaccharide/polyol phosphate transport system ATPase subunit